MYTQRLMWYACSHVVHANYVKQRPFYSFFEDSPGEPVPEKTRLFNAATCLVAGTLAVACHCMTDGWLAAATQMRWENPTYHQDALPAATRPMYPVLGLDFTLWGLIAYEKEMVQ